MDKVEPLETPIPIVEPQDVIAGVLPATSAPGDVVPERRSAASAYGSSLLTTAGILLVTLVSGMLSARMLGVEGRGQLAAILLWPNAIVTLGSLGIPVAYAFESARNPDSLPALARNFIWLCLVQSVVLVGAGVFILPLALGHMGSAVVRDGLWFSAAYVPLSLFVGYMNAINQGTRDFRRYNAVRIWTPASFTILLIAGAIVGARSLAYVVSAFAVSLLVGAAVTMPVLIGILGGSHAAEAKHSRELAWRTLRYGLRTLIGNLSPFEFMQIDLLVVVAIVGASGGGLYSVALSAAGLVRLIGFSVGLVILPQIAGETDHARRCGAYGLAVRMTLWGSALAAAFIGVFAVPLLRLVYGSPYTGAANLVRVMCFGMVFASVRQVMGDCLRGAGRPGAASFNEVVGWGAGVLGALLLVPQLGALGVAASVSIAFAVTAIFSCIGSVRYGVSIRDLAVPRRADARVLLYGIRSLLTRRSGSGPRAAPRRGSDE